MKLTLRKGPRLRAFENRVLRRRIFGPKRDEVTGQWRALYNEERNDLYPSPNIIRVNKSRRSWARHIARMVERKCVCRVLVGELEGRPWCRWEDNIEMDLQEAGCGGMDWIYVT